MVKIVKPVPTEPFTFVFAAAVIIFFTLFLMFGQEPLYDEDTPSDIDISEKGEIIFSAESASLLSNKTQTARTIDFGDFDVGYTSHERTIQEMDSLLIEKGVFRSSSKEFSFDGSGMEGAVLKFQAGDSNYYGNLRIYLNDELIFDDITSAGAKFAIEFNSPLDHNVVRIEAQSSGVKFWAPTTYMLSNVRLSATSFDNVDKMFSFTVYEYEMRGFDAALSYEVGSGSIRQGDMHIEINGNDINDEAKPMFGRIYKETFDRADGVIAAKPDTNYIQFSADKDSKYEIQDAQLTITYFDTDKAAIAEYTLMIDEDTYDDMYNETIVLEFYADKISEGTSLDIYLNDVLFEHDTELYENLIVMSQDDFRRGKTNVLKFSTYGIYKLSDIDIRIVEDEGFSLF